MGGAQLTLRAFDDTGDLLEGPDVANERDRLLEARQTLTFDLAAMFGPGATAATVASVAIKSGNDRPVATTIGTTPGGAYALRSQAPVEPAYFPFDRRDPGEMPLVSVAGAGAADFESRWTLMDTRPASSSRRGRAGGRDRGVPSGIPWTLCSVLMPRRCRWRATSGWNRWRLNSGEVSSTIPARGQPPCRRCSPWVPVGWCSPYFVIGGGYNTVITPDQCFGPDRSRNGNRIRYRWDGNRARIYNPDPATGHG